MRKKAFLALMLNEDSRLQTCQFPIASNRLRRIKEDGADKKTDYPWVKCFGPMAEQHSICLHTNSKVALGIVSGVSAEMIAASFNQSIPTSTGNAMPGYLQNLLWFSAIGIPIGQVGMQGKRLLQFHHNKSLQKTFGQKRGMRDSGNGNSRMI